jgi:hypothetical protein
MMENRRWRDRAVSIGEVLQRERRRAPLRVPAWRARVAEVVSGATDEDFASHAWVLSLRGGVLTIGVDDPVLAGVYRMRWRRPLQEALERNGRGLNIVDVRFRLAEPPDPPPRREADGEGPDEGLKNEDS